MGRVPPRNTLPPPWAIPPLKLKPLPYSHPLHDAEVDGPPRLESVEQAAARAAAFSLYGVGTKKAFAALRRLVRRDARLSLETDPKWDKGT